MPSNLLSIRGVEVLVFRQKTKTSTRVFLQKTLASNVKSSFDLMLN